MVMIAKREPLGIVNSSPPRARVVRAPVDTTGLKLEQNVTSTSSSPVAPDRTSSVKRPPSTQTPPSSHRRASVYPRRPFEPATDQTWRWPPGQLAYVASNANRSG